MAYRYKPGMTKQQTAEYPAVTPARLRASQAKTERLDTPRKQQAALAYALYVTYTHAIGQEPVAWPVLSATSQEIYLALADTALTWRLR